MKKYSIASLAFLLMLMSGFFLINCVEDKSQGRGGTTGPQGAGFTGFDPTNPNYSSSQFGFDPKNRNYSPSQFGFYSTIRGKANFTSTSAPAKSNPKSLKKSSFVLEREKRFGVSAPIDTDSIDTDVFDDFRLGESPFNSWDDISEFRVYVDLKRTGNNYYGGEVTIGYWDYGRIKKQERRVIFSSGTGDDAQYNVWFNKNNKSYHGFFQEEDGSLILVIDKKTDLAKSPDDTTPIENLYSGSIWIMMFRTTFKGQNSCNSDQFYVRVHNDLVKLCRRFPFNPSCGLPGAQKERIPPLSERNKKCWIIRGGPFDCRTWRNGDIVNTFRAVEPDDNCYAKLGEFNGLDITKAFGVKKVGDLIIK